MPNAQKPLIFPSHFVTLFGQRESHLSTASAIAFMCPYVRIKAIFCWIHPLTLCNFSSQHQPWKVGAFYKNKDTKKRHFIRAALQNLEK